MVNLKEIQDLLNSDPKELEEFHADPATYLESKGLVLPEEAKNQLRDNVKTKDASSGGAVWNVGIQVGPKD